MSDNSFLGYSKTREENEKLLKFLAQESKKADARLNQVQLIRDFIEKSGSSRNSNALRRQISKLLLKLSKMDNIDKETKVRMLFALSGPVNEEYLKELRKDAVVVIDGKKRITKYEANDGSLKLERKEKRIPRDFQEEKEEEDIKEGNRQMTKSGRVSKKLSLYDNSTSNETNKKLMDFDGHGVQLQSATMKIQNAGTSSKKDTIKRKVNTQISELTKKLKKTRSEGEAEPEADIVYEGPEEPPRPFQLPVKREPVEVPIVFLHDDEEQQQEKKPFIFGFFGNSGNLKLEKDVDFGVSPEDAVDSFPAALSESSSMNVSQPSSDFTNITKYLELLRSLVGTLESSKLCGLHEKIDLKIRKLGDKNLKAPTKHIRLALEASILFVTKNATSEYLEEDSISLKEYLHYFKAFTHNLTSPEFAGFQKALRDAINQSGNQERIPYEEIQYGLEHAIKLVLP